MKKKLEKELRFICREIGPRVFGSPEEARLAGHIARSFRAAGLETRVEDFPVSAREFRSVAFGTVSGGRRRPVAVLPMSLSGFTGGEMTLELEYLENISRAVVEGRNLAGKAALVYGGLGESLDDYRRLLASGVKALALMSSKYPVPWTISLGMPWNWEGAGVLPTVSLPYFEAERILARGVREVYVEVDGAIRPSRSQNVIGVKKGRGKKNIVVCAHHDSVSVGRGAIDNGTGAAILMALADRLSAAAPGAKNIVLISFGAEEILSQGSFEFVARYPGFAADTDLVVNIDGEGSLLGESRVTYTGTARLAGYLAGRVGGAGRYFRLEGMPSPYSDQFPFNMAGVPSAWFHRHNCRANYYQYHSRKDVPAAVDIGLVNSTARIIHEIVLELGRQEGMPFPRSIPARERAQIDHVTNLLGLQSIGIFPDKG